jgi:hypothetical protein
MKKKKIISVTFFVFLFAISQAFGQESRLYSEIQQSKQSNVRFKNIPLLRQGSTLSCLYRQVEPVKINGTRQCLPPNKRMLKQVQYNEATNFQTKKTFFQIFSQKSIFVRKKMVSLHFSDKNILKYKDR